MTKITLLTSNKDKKKMTQKRKEFAQNIVEVLIAGVRERAHTRPAQHILKVYSFLEINVAASQSFWNHFIYLWSAANLKCFSVKEIKTKLRVAASVRLFYYFAMFFFLNCGFKTMTCDCCNLAPKMGLIDVYENDFMRSIGNYTY